jgi:hypothetical protein
MSAYFENFPAITYGATSAINIMERCAILNSIFKNVYTFYPYQVRDGMKARTIAERYYGDPDLEWLVYYSNNIIDPYHQWPMDIDTFNSFLESQYGSIQAAHEKIVSYRINWYEDDRVLTKLQYNSLPPVEKKYWTPSFDSNNFVTSYVRKELDYLAIAQDGDGNVTISIPSDEQAYWSPVTAFDIEEEKNAQKMNIQLLDSRLVTTAIDNLQSMLSE